ncbi:MAG: hypothetical protein HUJ28_11510 [Chromatiales bacterium]|nr:hypothetical protein [Chromatiales bacterium]
MFKRLQTWIWRRLTHWLETEVGPAAMQPSDFERLRFEVKPCDVVLVEGRSRISRMIKTLTLSGWTHAALYVGRLHDIEDADIRALIERHWEGDPGEPLVIEALLGEGTIVAPLSKYRRYHLRICRPAGISRRDAFDVIRHAAGRLGLDYDLRQVFDLARFLFPWGIIPRRGRSSLFVHNAGAPTHNVCSSMIARAFHSVQYPVMPMYVHDAEGKLRLYQRNFRLFTPKDFDSSPYFEIIKYPLFAFDELAIYRSLPWDTEGVLSEDAGRHADPAVDGRLVEARAAGQAEADDTFQSINLLDDMAPKTSSS